MTHKLLTYFKEVPQQEDALRYKDIQTLIDIRVLETHPEYEARLYHLFEVMYGIECIHRLPSFDDVPMHVLPKTLLHKKWVLPLIDQQELTIGIYEPSKIQEAYQLYALTNKKITLKFIRKSMFLSYFQEYESYKLLQDTFQIVMKDMPSRLTPKTSLESEKPFIKYSDQLLTIANVLEASDIHLTVDATKGYVKYRMNGVLRTYHEHDKAIHDALMRRYKVLAHLHVGMDHMPQDGMFHIEFNQQPSMYRLACMPTFYGEHMVIRLVASSPKYEKVNDIGLTLDQYTHVVELLQLRKGLILVAGATGSGKSTTIHALLNHVNQGDDHIITLEDPIEKVIPNMSQIMIHDTQSINFQNALRHILRMDPDIVMIGEIRDALSASVALRASLTGHLVLSTIHASSPQHIVERLAAFQLQHDLKFLVRAMIFQTLVPLLCLECQGKGCHICKHTGVSKRRALFEIVMYDSQINAWQTKGITIRDAVLKLYEEGRISISTKQKLTT